MAVSGSGLVASSPAGPAQDGVYVGLVVPDEVGEQPADLGDGERDQVCRWPGRGPPFSVVAARVTVRKAWANMARVMWRYQLW